MPFPAGAAVKLEGSADFFFILMPPFPFFPLLPLVGAAVEGTKVCDTEGAMVDVDVPMSTFAVGTAVFFFRFILIPALALFPSLPLVGACV